MAMSCVFALSIACAQDAPRPVRIVISSERISSLSNTPQHFVVLKVDVGRGQSTTFSGPSGYVYVLAGKLELPDGAAPRALAPGEAAFIRSGQPAQIRNVFSGTTTLVHFLLVPGAPGDTPWYPSTVKATELYRTASPIPRLESGPYEFSLNKVTSPPKVKPPLHQRSGAAIYYVLNGAATLHTEGKSELRKAGMVQYEPNGFVHTWENSGATPLVLLQANISREGAPEIIFLR
jgi:quercetin dioxygenase-like cupin family protein